MEKQFNKPAVLKATERVDKLISFLLANSEADEEWKEIEWADTNYFISSKGRVLSLCNSIPRVLKAFMCNGYLCVSICGHDRRINRLVANAFIPNPDGKPIAHHKNHDKTKNTVANLAWATHSENTTAYFDSKKQEKIESEAPAG
ncbi:MAG: NUMOD4 motif-containing HNH endonuclease [Clostridia bacterium]|nr:NUMOD4 motif-containing HNH endonuclease [Clostridia bacterium]